MTLESWSMGIVRPVMEVYPYAWAFFVPFILLTTFAVLNLFIAIIVNAMQSRRARRRFGQDSAFRSHLPPAPPLCGRPASRALCSQIESFCFRAVRRSVRRQAQRDAAHRASLPTQRAPAARKPEGPGGFAPIPAGFGLAIAPLWPAPNPLVLSQIHSGRMVQFGCKGL
jgi:hypothetical protein